MGDMVLNLKGNLPNQKLHIPFFFAQNQIGVIIYVYAFIRKKGFNVGGTLFTDGQLNFQVSASRFSICLYFTYNYTDKAPLFNRLEIVCINSGIIYMKEGHSLVFVTGMIRLQDQSVNGSRREKMTERLRFVPGI